MPAVQSFWWCFTIFFTSAAPPDLVSLFDNTSVSYACWQEEESPTTKRRHLQGYLQLKTKKSLSAVKSLFGDLNPHLEKQRARKTDEACDYCMKEETRVSGPFEFGDYCPSGSHKRRQRESVIRSPVRMAEENPSVFRRVKAKIAEEEFQKTAHEIQISNLKSWQLRLKTLLEGAPDDRTIFWVYGPDGGEGKSTFARDLYRSGTWFYTRGGSADNVSYQYIGQLGNNIVFDIPRDKKDYLQYSLIEMFKDRLIVSNKYEPLMAPLINCIHVVVMSNFLPDFEKISQDRVHVIPCIPCGVCRKHHVGEIKCDEYVE
ncbi:replication protein [Chilli leaf curl India alphasatellite]|uniref:replication protein n=1 Tax=Chilli leaf curl India alphasatellite TaxID=1507725 RepID=UPI0006527944|nr:replication protein [Chilli leaf curl India alphasatellite]AIC83096.1 replication protein [Chilli leaf curl India alphasatellite]